MITTPYIGEPTIGHERPKKTDEIDFLFEGLLPRRGLAFILGRPKVGKSLFIIWLATCLATSKRVFEIGHQQPYRLGENFASPSIRAATLYLTGEDADIFPKRAESALRYLQEHNVLNDGLLIDGKLPIIRLPVSGLNGDENLSVIKMRIRDHSALLDEAGLPIRMVVIDTLTSVFDIADENDNSKMQRLMRCLREYGRQFNSLVVVIAHPNKNGKRTTGEIRGAGTVTASADAVFEISKAAGRGKVNRRTLRVASVRDGAVEGMKFEFEILSHLDAGVLYPVCDVKAVAQDRPIGKLDAKQIELLLSIEDWSSKQGEIVTSESGETVHGISLELMVKLELASQETDPQLVSEAEARRLKGRTRKQVERNLQKLVGLGILEKYTRDRKPHFRPVTNWDSVTDVVAELAPGSGYRSASTECRQLISSRYDDNSDVDAAGARAIYTALRNTAMLIPQLPTND